MAKILVRTPITSNGRDVVIGDDGKVKYRETIVEHPARKIFEKINTSLPPVLRHVISDYTDGDGTVTAPADIEIAKAKVKNKKNATE